LRLLYPFTQPFQPHTAPGAGIEKLREAGMTQLAQARMPTRRNEEFRFTDLAPLVTQTPVAADAAAAAAVDATPWTLEAADASRVVLVDGVFCADKSNLTGLAGVHAGMLSAEGGAAGEAASSALGLQSAKRGGVLAGLNAAMVGLYKLTHSLRAPGPVSTLEPQM
jgi:Fe-S cluster assembly protein SufD